MLTAQVSFDTEPEPDTINGLELRGNNGVWQNLKSPDYVFCISYDTCFMVSKGHGSVMKIADGWFFKEHIYRKITQKVTLSFNNPTQ